MLSLLPVVAPRPFFGLTAKLPRPAIAVSVIYSGINGAASALVGDGAGEVRRLTGSVLAPPLCRRPGRIVAVRATRNDEFALAFVPPVGDGVVEAWRSVPEGSHLVQTIRTFPRDARPILASVGDWCIIALAGETQATVYPAEGKPQTLGFSGPLVDLALASGGRWVASLADGTVEARDGEGRPLWRRPVARPGETVALSPGGPWSSSLAWTSREEGGRAGLIDSATGTSVGSPIDAPGAVRAYSMLAETPLFVGASRLWGGSRVDGWTAPSPIVASDAQGDAVGLALADGTLTIRLPLRPWIRHGDAPGWTLRTLFHRAGCRVEG